MEEMPGNLDCLSIGKPTKIVELLLLPGQANMVVLTI
jgi:hypothetical protein